MKVHNQTYTCINKCSHEHTPTHIIKFTHIYGTYTNMYIYIHTLSKQQRNNRDKKIASSQTKTHKEHNAFICVHHIHTHIFTFRSVPCL